MTRLRGSRAMAAMAMACAAATVLVARPAAQGGAPAGAVLPQSQQGGPPALPLPIPEHKVVPIQIVGDPATHFSLVVLGDGYTEADMPKFRAHLDKHLNILWSIEPFRSYRNYFNVYAIEVVSPVSGIDCDPEVRQQKVSALHASFGGGCTNINARGVTLDLPGQALVRELAARATPNFDQILVIANSDTYGGIGGRYATTTGGNALSPLITPHELGHSLGGLTDEYTYSARGRAGGTYDAARGEPGSANRATPAD